MSGGTTASLPGMQSLTRACDWSHVNIDRFPRATSGSSRTPPVLVARHATLPACGKPDGTSSSEGQLGTLGVMPVAVRISIDILASADKHVIPIYLAGLYTAELD